MNKMVNVVLGLLIMAIAGMASAAEAVWRAGEYMKERGERQ